MDKKSKLDLALTVVKILDFKAYGAMSNAEKIAFKTGITKCIELLSVAIDNDVIPEFALAAMKVMLNTADLLDNQNEAN